MTRECVPSEGGRHYRESLENQMPTVNRLMDLAIFGMVILDLVLTGLFFSGRSHVPRTPFPPQVTLAVSSQPAPVTDSASPEAGTDVLLTGTGPYSVLRGGPGAGDAQELFNCTVGQKWDYGRGMNTTQNWIRWGENSTQPAINQVNDVNAAMFLLRRAGDVTSEVFDCPSTQPSKRDYGGSGTAQNWVNWNGSSTQPATDQSSTAATFLLLRQKDTPGAQPWISPSSNAQMWDYGGGASATQNWMNWRGKSGQFIVDQSYSYENPYPASSKP